MADCVHPRFEAQVNVTRLEDVGRYTADVTIRCGMCYLPFQFLGLPAGSLAEGAAVSIDGLEARLAIAPPGAHPSPLQQMASGKEKFDG